MVSPAPGFKTNGHSFAWMINCYEIMHFGFFAKHGRAVEAERFHSSTLSVSHPVVSLHVNCVIGIRVGLFMTRLILTYFCSYYDLFRRTLVKAYRSNTQNH